MKRILTAALALTLAGLLAGCGEKSEETDISIPILETSTPVYNTTTAEIGDISEKYYGEASYGVSHDSVVYFPKNGQIAEINVEINKTVKKGDVLCVLRSEDIEEQIEEAQVWLDQSEETYNKLLKSSKTSASELEYARIDYELQKLNMDSLERDLAEYTIKAPCDGTINYINDHDRQLNVNTIVDPGIFCSISDSSQNELSCKMLQKMESVGYGTRAIITSTTGEAEGIVTGMRELGEGEMIQYAYEIKCDDPMVSGAGKYRVCFDVYDKTDVVTVPKKAIKTINERNFVNLLVDGVKIEQDVELGIDDGEKVEITNGLSGGEEIIINE
ncbi:MAG: biotin/lipoyl-binding protein [Ruminococcus sp.]|nr:biotin/lipoyl-binding protein [Ruminococcus sp.]